MLPRTWSSIPFQMCNHPRTGRAMDDLSHFHCAGMPPLIPSILWRLGHSELLLLRPPGYPSLRLSSSGQSFSINTNSTFALLSAPELRDCENFTLLLETKARESRCFWATQGFVPVTLENLRRFASRDLASCSVAAAFPIHAGTDALSCLGYLTPVSQSASFGTTVDFLQRKSNDYSLAAHLCQSLFNVDFVYGDCHHTPSHFDLVSDTISFVIPCYRADSTIANTVSSVLLALEPLPHNVKAEIIVVDDGCTTKCDFTKISPSVAVIRSTSRQHCAGARNLGLAVARGSIVFFLDADTYLSRNYIINHWLRHRVFPNLILVSLREDINNTAIPDRLPDTSLDSRTVATYPANWPGLRQVPERVRVTPLASTDNFRTFGYYSNLGPVDLPFMVKGNNFSIRRNAATEVGFAKAFEGWGPEDVSFAAKMIARGFFVSPVLSTGVFHVHHLPRSGSTDAKRNELDRNLAVYRELLRESPLTPWELLQ